MIERFLRNLFSSFLKRFKKQDNQTWEFPRGHIELIAGSRLYKIFSEDGEEDCYLILKIEDLANLAVVGLDKALSVTVIGQTRKFLSLSRNYWRLVARQKLPFDCTKRLTLSWQRQNIQEVAWVIDFRASLQDRLLEQRLFRKIAEYQFVEESDWYLFLVKEDWVELLKNILNTDLVSLHPVAVDLVAKRMRAGIRAIYQNKLDFYFENKKNYVGEEVENIKKNMRPSRSPSIPYEVIAKIRLEKYRLSKL